MRRAFVLQQLRVSTPYIVAPELAGFKEQQFHPSTIQALDSGFLQAKVTGVRFGTKSLHISLVNKSFVRLEIFLRRGTLFVNSRHGQQPLILVESKNVSVGPHSSVSLQLDAFCGVSTFSCPSGDDGNMALTPYFLEVPGVLSNQSTVWGHLNQFSPGRCPDQENAADEEYRRNQEEFSDFNAKCTEVAEEEERETSNNIGGAMATVHEEGHNDPVNIDSDDIMKNEVIDNASRSGDWGGGSDGGSDSGGDGGGDGNGGGD
jgi:hypothetical protein